ncbi:hypothetical protein NDU88_007366 [Pleurodeles waltl]|uniref:Uncharacterized protein n=1 Tax=Pleurodeles waltl TaxID=8319 RepID=A0AAV7MGQ6_PLEWA|nr:hypothetical protein NDU88_007366 [Pleurodeles waltl]
MHRSVHGWRSVIKHWQALGCRLVDIHRSAHGVVCYQALSGPGVSAGGHAPVRPWSGLLSSTGQLWGAGWWTCTGPSMDGGLLSSTGRPWVQACGHAPVCPWMEVFYQALVSSGVPTGGHAPVGPWSGGQLTSTGRPWGAGWWTCTGQSMDGGLLSSTGRLWGCRLVDMHWSSHGVVCYQALAGPGVPAGAHAPVSPWMEVCYQALAGSGGAGWWTCTGRPMEWSVIKHWQALGCRLVDMHRSAHGVVCYQALASSGVPAGGHGPVSPQC